MSYEDSTISPHEFLEIVLREPAKSLPQWKSAQAEEYAFEEALSSFCVVAWRHLGSRMQSTIKRRFLDLDLLRTCLIRDLARTLSFRADRTLVLKLNVARLRGSLRGETSASRYTDFTRRLMDGELRVILSEYPVLARLLAETTIHWLDHTCDMLQRLSVDYTELSHEFGGTPLGRLEFVEAGLSDLHCRGRSVSILRFESGTEIVYKPRSVRVDIAFDALVSYLNDKALCLPFPRVRSFSRVGYGWQERVRQQECANQEEVRRFYRLQGQYLMLFYLIGGTDFHRENIIARGADPIFIDLEALFHHTLPAAVTDSSAKSLGFDAIESSVLSTCLLPMWIEGPVGVAEMGGLGGRSGQESPGPVPRWTLPATDEMRQIEVPVELPGSQNLPTISGAAVEADAYVDDIASGFVQMYQGILKCRPELDAPDGPLDQFADVEVRHILRPTHLYLRLFRDSLHPDYQRNTKDRATLLEKLVPSKADDLRIRLAASERRDIERGDVPVFRTRPGSLSIVDSTGTEFPQCFQTSGLDRTFQRLRELRHADMTQQLYLLQASMATKQLGRIPSHGNTRGNTCVNAGLARARRADLIEAAAAIGRRLEDLAHRQNGSATWIGVSVTSSERWTLAPVGPDLYGGSGGIAMFLGYLGRATGKERFTLLAREAVNDIRTNLESFTTESPIGALSGTASIIYTLSHLGTLWRDRTLISDALKCVSHLRRRVEEDQDLDLLAGAAGAIPVLLYLGQMSNNEESLLAAEECGNHLIRRAVPHGEGVGWPSAVSGNCLAGFSHGVAGIAWSLQMLSHHLQQTRFRRVALAGLAYEQTLYTASDENWCDLRGGSAPIEGTPVAWCHGAPGVALGRLLSMPFDDSEQSRNDVRVGLATTLRAGFGGNHSLCHGDLGNLDVLLQAATILGNVDKWLDIALRHANALLQDWHAGSAWRCGVPGGVETPGLFLGLAGIGYQLLRLADPHSTPSVLSLSPPKPNLT